MSFTSRPKPFTYSTYTYFISPLTSLSLPACSIITCSIFVHLPSSISTCFQHTPTLSHPFYPFISCYTASLCTYNSLADAPLRLISSPIYAPSRLKLHAYKIHRLLSLCIHIRITHKYCSHLNTTHPYSDPILFLTYFSLILSRL